MNSVIFVCHSVYETAIQNRLHPKKIRAGIEIFDKTYVDHPVFISVEAHTKFIFRKIVQLLYVGKWDTNAIVSEFVTEYIHIPVFL